MLITWSSRERNRSCSPLSRRSRGRIEPPPITFRSTESSHRIRGKPKLQIARKSTPEPQFPANPIAEIPAISIANQSLQDISRTTNHHAPSPSQPHLKIRYASSSSDHCAECVHPGALTLALVP